jgi:hypothetical protein
MEIGSGRHRYRWIEHWARIPEGKGSVENGRTHGVVVSASGTILVFHQAEPAVLVYDGAGKLIDRWGDRFHGAHGMTLVNDGGKEYLWLTDEHSGEVVKTTLDGTIIQSLEPPDYSGYADGKYCPTWVAVSETRRGGNGDVWVADGYGMSIVHRYNHSGKLVQSITGDEGYAGRFDCPHGIMFDYHHGLPELLVADRGNKRFQVYSGDGRYLRTFGTGTLTSPDAAVFVHDEYIVPELTAKVTVLDKDYGLVCRLGDNEQTCSVEGWPNHPDGLVHAGKFIAPHALAVDAKGNIYVVEWKIGGRITKLERLQ